MRGWRRWFLGSLRIQLIAGMVAANVLAMTLFIAYLTVHQRETLRAMQRSQVQDLARNLAEAAAPWVRSRDVAGLQELVQGLKGNPQVSYAMLLDDRGMVLAHTDPGKRHQFVLDLPGPQGSAQVAQHGLTLDALVPCVMGSERIGWARVGFSGALVEAQIAQAGRAGALIALLSTGLIMLVSAGIGRSMTRRLYLIRRVSAELAGGHNSRTIPPLGEDEIGALGRDLNRMLAFLQASAAEIRALNTNLEAMVVERTEALTASHTQLRTLLHTLPDMVWLKDPDGVYLSCNRRFESFFGAKEQAIQGRTDADFVGAELAAQFLEGDRLAMASGGATITEPPKTITFAEDGHQEIRETLKTPLLNSRGQLLGVLGLGRNITEREQATQALKVKEERLRLALEATEDAIWDWDLASGDTYRSPRWFSMLGYPEGYRQEGVLDVRALIHPEDLDQVTHASALAISHGLAYSVDARLRCLDGSWRWIRTRGSVSARDAQGKAIRISGTNTDIHQGKVTEEENISLTHRLNQSQKMESLGVLAGGVAHDMNNVLGAILALASAQLTRHPEDSQAYRSFETICAASQRGGDMVKRMLAFARNSPMEQRSLDLNALLLDQARLLERTTLAKVRVELDLSPELRPIHGDSSALAHAIMNLCVNAVDAMAEGGTLAFRTRNLGPDQVELAVADSGSGMTPEVLARAMDPFFTTKEVGKGTGLGLSLVFTTVKAHGGQLEIVSEPGQGTQVRMRLPALVTMDLERAPRPAPALAAPSPGLKVLVVDDDELIQISTGMLVEVLGHLATPAASGEAAMAMIERGFRPDVVLLDMNMPGLGGKGTLPRLRALLPEVPILLATGRADQDSLDLVAGYGRVTLMPKPFGIEDLRDHLQSL